MLSSRLLYGLVCSLVISVPGQSVSKYPSRISIDVPVREYETGYLNWMGRHPQEGKGTSVLILPNPYLEIFSPKGQVLYQGSDDRQNAEVIRRLQEGDLPREVAKAQGGPTLRDYVEMLSELKPYQSDILDGTAYTVIAITNQDLKKCKEQDAAVKAFTGSSRIRLFEVRVTFS